MRKFISIFPLIMFCLSLNAQSNTVSTYPRLTFGAEWGYVSTFHVSSHSNFFSDEGYRYNHHSQEFGYWSNGEAYINIGYNFDEHWNLSLYTGFCGMVEIHNVFPISLRATRYYGSNPLKDRWFTYIDAGSGVSLKKEPQEILTGKLGGGYRISLSKDTKIDFMASMRVAYTHPTIEFEGETIDLEWTNRNDAVLISVSIGMAVVF